MSDKSWVIEIDQLLSRLARSLVSPMKLGFHRLGRLISWHLGTLAPWHTFRRSPLFNPPGFGPSATAELSHWGLCLTYARGPSYPVPSMLELSVKVPRKRYSLW